MEINTDNPAKTSKHLIFPLITFIAFIITGIGALVTGIEHHQTWRIVLSAFGIAAFLFLTAITVYELIRNKKNGDRG